jgi:nucleoside-diphosphate-sugar epimerase
VNAGWGQDISIFELAELIRTVVGFDGRIESNPSMPDGTPRKLLDTARLTALGWVPTISLQTGIEVTYRWYCKHYCQDLFGNGP